MKKEIAYLIFMMSLLWFVATPRPIVTEACVGRTIYIGFYGGEADQEIISKTLAIFIDERTGTSVKLMKLRNREQGFDYLRRDKVSIIVEYPGKIMNYYARLKGKDVSKNDFPSQRARIGGALKAIFVATPGYDSSVAGNGVRRNLGKAYIILSKKALSRFPALPRLLKKLSGMIGNDTMGSFIRERGRSSPEGLTRDYLKKQKLI